MSRISRRVGAITESATLAVDAKAKALQAAGEDVIGFGAGEPDFPTPPAHRRAAAAAACRRSAQPPGTRRRRVCRSCARRSRPRPSATPGSTCDAAQVSSPTAGSTRSTTRSRRCSTRATRCSSPRPTGRRTPKRSRSPVACRSGARRPEATGFRVTVEQLEAARTPRTKVLLFVSPSNPTGAVYPPAEVEAIGRWALEHGIWVRDRRDLRAPHLRRARVLVDAGRRCPSLADTCVVLNGVAKTYAMTGWRVGWMIGPADVTAAAINLQSHSTSNVAERGAARRARGGVGRPRRGRRDARRVRPARPRDARAAWRRSPASRASSRRARSTASRRSRACSVATIGGARRPPRSSCASCCSTKRKVAIVPGEAFGAPGYARLCFALGDDDLGRGRRTHRQVPDAIT